MNTPAWVVAALFFTSTLTLLLLPFVPAWMEWRRPTDADPLPVPLRQDEEQGLVRRLRTRAAAQSSARRGPPIEFRLPTGRALVARGNLRVAPGARLAVALAGGAIDLGRDCELLEGAHAEGVLRLQEGCRSLHSLSSATAIELAPGCCFEELDAPVVRFGSQPDPSPAAAPGPLPRGEWEAVPGARRRSAKLVRVDGDCELAAGRQYLGSLVVHGAAILRENAVLEGDLKATRGVLLAPGARVRGAVISEAGVLLLRDAAADGPVVSTRHAILSAGARIGSLDHASSITASIVVAEAGAVVHGSVRAHRAGTVWEHP